MKIRTLPVVLAAMGAIAMPLLVVAETPNIFKVSLECKYLRGANHTVKVVLHLPEIFHPEAESNQFNFRNTSGQTFSFLASPISLEESFPVPPGTYKLTVNLVQHNNMNLPVSGGSAAVYNDSIVVPPILSTGGRGTGCRF